MKHDPEWSITPPTLAGAYRIRRNIYNHPMAVSLVDVQEYEGNLVCNIGMINTDVLALDEWMLVSKLDPEFEWQGPLKRPMVDSDPFYRDPTDDQIKADVYDVLTAILEPYIARPGRNASEAFLTASLQDSVQILLDAHLQKNNMIKASVLQGNEQAK